MPREISKQDVNEFSDKIIDFFQTRLGNKSEELNDRSYMRMSISMRLMGAYQNYKLGNELESLRHVLLAMQAVAHAIGWMKVERFLEEQNNVLYEEFRRMREAGKINTYDDSDRAED